jgi:hypothetical protein
MSRIVASAIEAALEGEDHESAPRKDRRGGDRHRGVKAVAAGAVLVAAARVVSSQAPKLSKLGALSTLGKVTRFPDMVRDVPERVRDVPERVRDRLADSGWIEADEFGPDDVAEDFEEDEDLEEGEDYGEPEGEADLEDEEPAAEEPADDEPEGEGDEGPEDEGDDWPDDEDDDGGGGDAAEAEEDDEEAGVAASSEGSAVEQAAQGLGIDTNGHRASARGPAPDVISMLSSHRPPPLVARAERERLIDPVTRPPEPPTTESASQSKPSRSGASSGSRSGGSSGPKSRSRSSKSRSAKPKSGSRKSAKPKSGSTKSGPRKAKAGSR